MAKEINWLVPPRRVTPADGQWRLPKRVVLGSDSDADALGLEKTAAVVRQSGRDAVVGGPDAQVRVVRNARLTDPEGYRLTIGPAGVTVEASTDAGAFYGLATLRELLRMGGAALACMKIDDAPAFARRGVYHDCARGKVPRLETLLGLVERLAEWKINELQLYVENAFRFEKHPAIWQGYSPLTPSDITKLQAHCGRHHIRLVPSLSSFGHMEKVLLLKQYAPLNELPHGSTLCPTDPGSIRFVEELYEEFLPLFEAEDFNVCCDETWDLGKGRTYDECRRRGEGQVYLDFLLKIRKLCQKFGRRMNAWSDVVLNHPETLDRVPRDIVMLNWGYEADSERLNRSGEIAKAGLPMVLCPGTSSWNTIASRWTNAHQNIRQAAALAKRYSAEGVLNTDWGDLGHRQFLAVSLMPLAFGAAESWKPGAADIEAFPRRFSRQAFGDADGRIGDAIEALGTIYLRYGITQANRDPMTSNLQEPLRPENNALWYTLHRQVDRYRPEALASVLEALPEAGVWKQPAGDPFDALSLAEFALSARIIALYCFRSSVAWQMGMGETVGAATYRKLAEQIDRTAKDFAAMWNARNKPSRLRDNLRLFKDAAAEARRYARG
ncbi:MAG: family 20 glycosylhydrolase [Planctomycetes bacterium]|nr:family 20 glycosylhydrolase [Planctomycetota bacterium]